MAFHDNERLQDFLKRLDAAGVMYRWAWETRRDGKSPRQPRKPGADSTYPDVGMLLFSGRGFQPSVLTAIVVDYSGEHNGGGFGLYLDAPSNSITADVDAIVGTQGKPVAA